MLTWILLWATLGATITALVSLWMLNRYWRTYRIGLAQRLADLRDEHPQEINGRRVRLVVIDDHYQEVDEDERD